MRVESDPIVPHTEQPVSRPNLPDAIVLADGGRGEDDFEARVEEDCSKIMGPVATGHMPAEVEG
jgi:hypothetical protein